MATGAALVVVGLVVGGRTGGALLGCGAGADVALGAGAALLVWCCGTGALVLPEEAPPEPAAEVVGLATAVVPGTEPEGATAALGVDCGFCWTEPVCPFVPVSAEESAECAVRDITVVKTNVAAIAT